MTDPATLAREARRALAQAHTATLLVEGLGRISPDPAHVLLDDRDGRPRFTCAAGSPIAAAAAARCPAILDVGMPVPSGVCAGSVIFAGHLAVGGDAVGGDADGGDADGGDADGRDADGVHIVELHLVSVVVEVDDPQSHTVVARRIPLDVYAGRPGPTLAAAAETMRLHTNARHADRLRTCAAARAGIPDDDVIAARLLAVGPGGAELEWLDTEGGHTVRLGFPRAAVTGPELAALLRAQLCAHRNCS